MKKQIPSNNIRSSIFPKTEMQINTADIRLGGFHIVVTLFCLCVGCSETGGDAPFTEETNLTIIQRVNDPAIGESQVGIEEEGRGATGIIQPGITDTEVQQGKVAATDMHSEVAITVKSFSGNALRDRLGEILDRAELLDEVEIIELLESLPVGNVAERALAIGVRNLAGKNPEMALNWLETTPELSQRERHILAEVAGNASGYKNPLKNLEMASSLHRASEINPELAVEFASAALSSWVSVDVTGAKDGFLQLAKSNPELAALSGSDQWILSRFLEETPSVGLAFGRDVDARSENSIANSGWFESLGSAWVKIDPSQGMDWGGKELRGTALESYRRALVLDWVNHAPSDALNWVSSVEDARVRKEFVRLILPSLSRIDPEGAHEWRKTLGD